jgi:hypothetical protein
VVLLFAQKMRRPPPLVTQEIQGGTRKQPTLSEIAGDPCNLLERRFQMVIVGKVIWIFALPAQVAGSAQEIHAPWIEKAELIKPVVGVDARGTTNEATAAVTPVDVAAKPLPCFRFHQFSVIHKSI